MDHTEIIINKHYPGMNPVIFGYEECESSHFYGPHVRQYWLLHYVVSGTGIFRREGQTWQIRQGEIFVIPPYMETYYEADAKTPWQYIWIGFETDMELPEAFQHPVLRCASAGLVFEEMRACHGMQNGKSAYLSACLWRLLYAVLEQEKQSVDYLEQALNLIHSEYASSVNVTQIATRIGLDRSYFTAMFAKHMGMAPGKYLANLRLEKAVELMVHYGESPSVAAASVGYTDICNFSKAFKRKYGTSPGEYRKLHHA